MVSAQELESNVRHCLTMSKAEAFQAHQQRIEAGWEPKYMEILFNNSVAAPELVEKTTGQLERRVNDRRRFAGAIAIDGCVTAYDEAVELNNPEVVEPGIAIWTKS